ncbi:MAG TPA: Hsp20/alpha crystallin family protein [Abditibacterium sp.]|jgi:HSP20 family protein
MNPLLSRDVHDLRGRMNRLSEESAETRSFRPAVDVAEDAHEIVLQVELPGIRKEDIDIQLTGDTLRLSGERKREQEARGEYFHRVERSYGAFARTFQIETPIDAAKVSAAYEEGVLTLRLPKQEAVKPRQIEISSN